MKQARCSSWKSPITSDLIVAESIGLSEVAIDGAEVYWLESRPKEAGRNVVVRRSAQGQGEEFSPKGFNVRDRVHEYGGGAWTVSAGTLYFSHDDDQRLYRLDAGSSVPVALTPSIALRFADGLIDSKRQRWIGVRQDHTQSQQNPTNTIVSIDGNGMNQDGGTIIASGHDFFSSPKLSPDGRRLCYLAWDHPNMPWVGTTLYLAELNDRGLPYGDPVAIAGGSAESIFQPEWDPEGARLFFVSDRSGWWNLYAHELGTGETRALAPAAAEFGQPQWVFGMSTYACAGPGRLVCSYSGDGLGRLGLLDVNTGQLDPIDIPFTDFASVRALGNRVVFKGGAARAAACTVELDLATRKPEILKKSTDIDADPAIAKYFTDVQSIQFPTGGGTAFGLYYPAFNPDYSPLDNEKPPLVVKCHGGPTGSASSTLDLKIHYWTSRGISVLDVNYGGSTGFGREYRDSLHLSWGIRDVDDCVNGATYLAKNGFVDEIRSVITGGSAGGYTTLACLTFRKYFHGGASYYGVSDPVVLARDTHKFESRYLDWLIGPYPEAEAVYRERSPLDHAEELSSPIIFFQGDEDAVVPPNQAELMIAALRKKGTSVGYLLFSGEQHGFRKGENIKRALDAELYFYSIAVFQSGLTF